MRTGDLARRRRPTVRSRRKHGFVPGRQRGFTYLLLLFALAAGAAALALLGERASAAVQRERERELMFRGHAIADAIAAYASATPGEVKTLPKSLDDLVEDRRGPQTLRHLRRVYTDPFTGLADWRLIVAADGRIAGVRSRSDTPAMRTVDLPELPPGQRARVSDRAFMSSAETAASSPNGSP